jgi:hypothetical protein
MTTLLLIAAIWLLLNALVAVAMARPVQTATWEDRRRRR